MAFLPADTFTFITQVGDDAVPAERIRHPDTYDLDLDTGQFQLDGDAVSVLSGTDSLRQSIEKALHTRRAVFFAYDHDYGHDYGQYLDTDPEDTPTRTSLLSGHVIDVLSSVPGVSSVLSASVTVLDIGTNEVSITARVVDTFGQTLDVAHTLEA